MSVVGCRAVVGGVDLQERFGLVMTDESVLGPPPFKRCEVDVPGGDGSIDLSDALSGGPVYGNREHVFVLRMEVGGPREFERVKTEVSHLLHGRRLRYELTCDPGYSYEGRFEVDEYYSRMRSGCIRLKVAADPYKLKERCTYRVNAAGGIVVTLESGRRPACPTFEFASETIVACGDVVAQMQPGSYKVNDLWLHEGVNELYLNSYLGEGNVAAEEHMGVVVEDVWDRRVSDLMWEGVRGGAALVEDWERDTVEMHWDERVVDAEFAVSAESERYAVYVQYEWEDL